MGKTQGVASSMWSQDVARAVALQRHMPGVQQLQTQYVRYTGQPEAQQCDDGWLLSASRAQAAKVAPPSAPMSTRPADSGAEACMSTTGPPSTPPTPSTRATLPHTHAAAPPAHASHASLSPTPHLDADPARMSMSAAQSDACASGRADEPAQMPQQVQLHVASAPAEFCMPIKRDRRFRPNFQVEVRVVHTGTLHLPLRVGVFAVSQGGRERIQEWLPSEFVPVAEEATDSDERTGSPSKRKKASKKKDKIPLEERLRRRGLKTHTVLSHVFRYPEDKAAPPESHSEAPKSTPEEEKSAAERYKPFFPSFGAARSGPPDPSAVELLESKSLIARSDDPELATRIKLGGVRNTLLAQFEFPGLEFEIPSEVTPVYLVFACLVANKDLLYTLYHPPSVSMCRRDQQTKSLLALGLPKNAMQQVEALRGSSRSGPAPSDDSWARGASPPARKQRQDPGPRTPASHTSHGGRRPAIAAASTRRLAHDDSDKSSQAMETPKSAPASGMHMEASSLWDTLHGGAATFPSAAAGRESDPQMHARDLHGRSIAEELAHLEESNIADWDMPGSANSPSMLAPMHGRRWSNPATVDRLSHGGAGGGLLPEIRTPPDLKISEEGGFGAHETFAARTARAQETAVRQSETSAAAAAAPRGSFWNTPAPGLQYDDMKLMLPSQASLDKVAPPEDPWGPLPDALQQFNPDSSEAPHLLHALQLLEPVTSQSAVHAPHASDALAFPPFSQHPRHPSGHPSTEFESGQLNIHMPPATMAPPPAGGPIPAMVRHESDAMSTDDGGLSGGLHGGGGFSGLLAIPAAQPPLSTHAASGVTQAAVFSWTHEQYCSCNTLRELTCVEARSLLVVAGFAYTASGPSPLQAPLAGSPSIPHFTSPQSSLLSLAGFPDLAGVDKTARISASQFLDFRAFFSATLASVRSVARFWNERSPSVVLGGFDVDQAGAAEALRAQPAGTFLCFFSMQAQFAGHLVVACKVLPGQAGTDRTAWQPQLAYLAVNPEDLHAGNLEGILMGMPYATHILDVYTGQRHDKRSRLSSTPRHIHMHGSSTIEGST